MDLIRYLIVLLRFPSGVMIFIPELLYFFWKVKKIER